MQPELVKDGYNENFAAATSAAGGTVGIIIPLSIIFIFYGFIMNLYVASGVTSIPYLRLAKARGALLDRVGDSLDVHRLHPVAVFGPGAELMRRR